jgi:hypothetical protein
MRTESLSEAVRVLFHLNGYTKVVVERTEGVGLAEGGIVWELPTERIPVHLRRIGSRFIVQMYPLSPEAENDTAALHEVKNRFKILEPN